MKLFDSKEELEDFLNFMAGALWVAIAGFVVAGVGLMALKALGILQ